jgi:hypothetical protein
MLIDISYTVSLEELPERMRGLLEEDVEKRLAEYIYAATRDIGDKLSEEHLNHAVVLEKLNAFREELAYADMRLKNIAAMIAGLQGLMAEQASLSLPQVPKEEEVNHDQAG